ncbi:vitellogenin-3-like [Bradysia coprophila]|uniref:vitellogenin-3-like n=1 Tax=Bradysia coprophila TaxID=38358 RepID=UPI00187DA2E9|nr:vitellogenin-3-like [Bradysia coprophila]
MQWFRSLLIIVLIGLVSVDGAWKQNQEYNYNVYTKTLSASKDETWHGVIFRARLTIRPESDELLIGKFSRPQYAKLQTSTRRADSDVNDLHYNDLPMEQPFNIVLKNGVVKALLVNRRLNEDQVNQLKFVVKSVMNQLRLDRSAPYQMDGDNAAYNVNEETMFGNCATVYEISPLPHYLAQSSRDLVPLLRLQNQEQYIDVVKSRDYTKCFQRRDSERLPISNRVPIVTEVNRIILSGSLNDYTVQSSVSTLKTADRASGRLKTISNVNLTLESLDTNTRYSPIQVDALMDVENDYPPRTSRKTLQNVRMIRTSPRENLPDENGEIRLSSCWKWFPSTDTVCYGDFGAEWEGVERAGTCGFLSLGKKAKCQRSFPGCEATACHSFFAQDLCSEFDGRLPVKRGGIDNCAPGFWRRRCCPN